MAQPDISVSVHEFTSNPTADVNKNSMTVAEAAETSASISLPVLRVEELKENLSSNLSYTSGEDEHSPQVSDDPDRKDGKEEDFVPPSDELKDKIIKQVEFYFSDANILKDAFLLKHVRRNKMGYVSIKLITSFKKMKSLTKDYRVVAYSLKFSDQLEVNEEGKKVRRKNPLPEYDETTPSRSVLAINLPVENPSIENIAEMFSKCGEVALIRILKPSKAVPQDIKKYANKHPEIGTTVCAVIEFEKHDHAQKAVETMSDKDDWKKGMRVLLLAESKKKNDKEKLNERQANGKGAAGAEHDGDGDDGRKKKKRGGRKHKNKHLGSAHEDSSCYSSGSEYDPPTRRNVSLSPNPNQNDSNKLSPNSSPRTSPRSSPMSSPRSRRKMGPHGKSPLAETSPNPSPGNSPETRRKQYDYSSGGDSTPSSPWVQRRLKAAQEMNISPLVGNSPVGSPMLFRKGNDGHGKLADLGGVIRQPKGPDGTRGFHLGRGKPRASTIC